MSAVVLDDVMAKDQRRFHPGGATPRSTSHRWGHDRSHTRVRGPVTGISDACSACSGFGRDRTVLVLFAGAFC